MIAITICTNQRILHKISYIACLNKWQLFLFPLFQMVAKFHNLALRTWWIKNLDGNYHRKSNLTKKIVVGNAVACVWFSFITFLCYQFATSLNLNLTMLRIKLGIYQHKFEVMEITVFKKWLRWLEIPLKEHLVSTRALCRASNSHVWKILL